MTTISIALATYNGERFLREQLQSLARQTRMPDELVACDDGSADSTLELLEEFSKLAPFPVRIERNTNRLGFQRNFLRCAELCNSQYISFCDQDDIWLPEKVERILNRIGSSHPDLVFHNAIVFDKTGDTGPLYSGIPESIASTGTDFFTFAPLGFTVTFDQRLLRFNYLHASSRDPYKFGHLEAHDQWIHFLATLSGRIEYIPEVLARYRQHESNLIGLPGPKKRLSILYNLAASSRRQAGLWDCARRRLKHLEEIDRSHDIFIFSQLHIIKRLYRESVEFLNLRKSIYNSRSWMDRLQSILRLIQLGAYKSSTTRRTFGSKGLAKDLLVGLPLAFMLRRKAKIC